MDLYSKPPTLNQPSLAETDIDERRRLLIGGLASAVSMALLSGCKQETSEKAAAISPAKSEPVIPAATVQDVTIPAGMEALPAKELAYAINMLAANISIDIHCHPGMFFFAGMEPDDPTLKKMASQSGFQSRTMADLSAGNCSAALFSTVSDIQLIGAGKQGLYAYREFKPGEAYRHHQQQVLALHGMVKSGLVLHALTIADVVAAKQAGKTAAIFTCEGGDFIEKNIDRIEEAWRDGIRSISLVHYHVNQMGDIQTAAPVHNGLTKFGKQSVREMNRLGIMVDLAHASYRTSLDAVRTSTQPVMISHSFLADDKTPHPRLLSADHALMVAETGGVIGAWPAGIGTSDFNGFISRLLRLVDVVGIDHVSLGTDMDANYKPLFSNYRQMPYLPAALKRRGMQDDDIVKVLGGNFMRAFDQVTRAGIALN
jgi:membrane dipeptidase